MPKKNTLLYPKSEILSLNDLKRITKILINLGIKKIRITGGEPLIRKDISEFLEYICSLKQKGLEEVLITTNGTQLKKYAKKISDLGIKKINISLDSLSSKKFKFLTNGGNLTEVLNGIYEAKKNKLDVKINTVLLKDFNENEILKMVKWCADNNFKQTFIEVMPVGKLDLQRSNQFLPVSFAQEKIKEEFGLDPIFFKSNGPSRYFKTNKLSNIIGFISPLTDNFCSTCNRIRVTSNGVLYPCLGDNGSTNLVNILKFDDNEISQKIKNIIFNKPEKHLFSVDDKTYINNRYMNTTGG
tara:strand:+ start:163 stop:1059 length:897 start_codon:yes stop_codon:yes gene_type:complete